MTILFTLSELNHSFPLIGLSETKISHGKHLLVNVNSSGYDFISEPSLVPWRSLLIRCPREVWEREGERTRSRRVSLGDVTAHGRVQEWRKRLGTRLL